MFEKNSAAYHEPNSSYYIKNVVPSKVYLEMILSQVCYFQLNSSLETKQKRTNYYDSPEMLTIKLKTPCINLYFLLHVSSKRDECKQ